MQPDMLNDLIRRYEGGDRSPDLLRALNEAAWTGFHDPWEPGPTAGGAEMSGDTVQPFTIETIERHLKGKDLPYWKADWNACMVSFGYHRGSDRYLRAFHFVEGKDADIYRLRLIGDRRVDPVCFEKALQLCNRWNDDCRWPRAFLEFSPSENEEGKEGSGPEEPRSAILVLDFQLLLEKGIHQDLFDSLVSDAICGSWSFWKRAKAEGL